MAEPKFVIQGVDYSVASWDTFDMGEAEILTAKTGLTLVDLSGGDIPLTPGLLSTMMIVAYMRENPNATRATAEKIVAKVKLLDALEHIGGEDEDEGADALPPPQTPQPDESESSGGSQLSSGVVSSPSSDSLPVAVPLPTGPPKLVTSQDSDQVISSA